MIILNHADTLLLNRVIFKDGNIRLLIEKYDMNVKNIVNAWNERLSKNEELVRVCEQVKEVVGMRDRYIGSVVSRSECDDILTFLCTG